MRRLVLGLLLLAACSDEEATLEGTYHGDDSSGSASFPAKWSVTITRSGNTLGGSYHLTGIGLDNAGTVAGTFMDPQVSLTLTPTDTTKCTYDVGATWEGGELRATYTTSGCFVVASGAVTLKK